MNPFKFLINNPSKVYARRWVGRYGNIQPGHIQWMYRPVGVIFYREYRKQENGIIEQEIKTPERPYGDMHGTYKRIEPLIGNENIHFIFDGTHRSDKNNFFEIKRI